MIVVSFIPSLSIWFFFSPLLPWTQHNLLSSQLRKFRILRHVPNVHSYKSPVSKLTAPGPLSQAYQSTMASGGKKPAPEHDSEDAPMLTNDNSSNDREDGSLDDEASGRKTAGSRARRWFRRVGRRLWRNRMVVAIILLLLGGFIALCVYFGGTLHESLHF